MIVAQTFPPPLNAIVGEGCKQLALLLVELIFVQLLVAVLL